MAVIDSELGIGFKYEDAPSIDWIAERIQERPLPQEPLTRKKIYACRKNMWMAKRWQDYRPKRGKAKWLQQKRKNRPLVALTS